jgi:hypothetical protein
MALIPLDIPAGFYRNGTDLEQAGRWRDGSLVRWRDNSLRPIGGWRSRKASFSDSPVRGMHSWETNGGNAWLAGASHDVLNAMTGGGTIYDITPADLAAGRADALQNTGFGGGFYGLGYFGQPIQTASDSIPLEATTWSLDNWGEYLVGLHYDDGRLLEWDLTIAKGAELVTNGEFATDTDWTKGTNWSIAGGVAEYQQNIQTFDADDAVNTDVSTDTITITGHGFVDGDEVTYVVPAAPATALGGLTDGTNYFIVSATANTIQLAATSGGAAIDLTRNALTFDGDDAAVVDVANDKIVDTNTFTTGDYVTYSNGGDVDIGGLTDGAKYYIIAATASEFQLSLTSGGAAIDLTANNSVTIDSADVAVVEVTDDKIITANTFANGDIVTYDNGGGTDIGGLVDGTDYYIINASATEFQLSATSGGAAIDITAVGVGAAHVFRQDIGSTHSFTVDHGDNHELIRQNYGNLDQTVSGLTTDPDTFAHDIIVTLIDPDDDSDATTIPAPSVKVTGTTTTTVLVNQTLAVGENRFRFAADDTEVKIEIIPSAVDMPNFDVDDISLRQVPTALPIDNAPTNNLGLVVTEERFLFALGAGDNPRKVQWCDREANTVWTPAATNEAGDIELQTSGQIMQGIRTRGQTLIITDTDAHTARYLGPPYVYGFERVGTSCGAISRKAASDVDVGVFWMGQRGFFRFDGNSVSEVPCDVHDFIFGDFNVAQQSKVWSVANGQYGEIWWFYCSGESKEIDRYVALDYKENHWLIGELSRTAGVDRSVFQYSMMASYSTTSAIYDHEVGYNYDSATTFAETGPISIGTGEQITKVTKLIPDEITQGDVDVTFKTRFYPNATEVTHGPFTPANPTSVRFSGRQLRMRVEGQRSTQWKVGNMRIDAIAGGRR